MEQWCSVVKVSKTEKACSRPQSHLDGCLGLSVLLRGVRYPAQQANAMRLSLGTQWGNPPMSWLVFFSLIFPCLHLVDLNCCIIQDLDLSGTPLWHPSCDSRCSFQAKSQAGIACFLDDRTHQDRTSV